jgi:DNA-binding transcriptional MerR regulator
MVQVPDDKRYFRIGEVSRIIGVEPHVLRYWESEFPQVKPYRPGSNQRTYQRKDIEILLEIKRLLYEEKMTVMGAKKRLQTYSGERGPDSGIFGEIKKELRDVLQILNSGK